MIMGGQIFVLSAPSGAGKSSIAEALMKRVDGMAYSVSHTSRPPRGRERNGVDYHFINQHTFREMIEKKAFLEWAEVHAHLYGTALDTVKGQMTSGLDILMDVDVQGGRNVKDQFSDAVLIFILPPSLKILEKRLTARGTDDRKMIQKRMAQASEEIKNCWWYDYIIINNDLKKAVFEAQSIILSSRCRSERRMAWVSNHFELVNPSSL
jgi:guanylate kinase